MFLISLLALVSAQTVAAPVPHQVLTVTVQKLPANYVTNPVLNIAFTPQGVVSTCTVAQTSGSPGIDKVACRELQTGYSVKVKPGSSPLPEAVIVAFTAEK